LGVLVTIGVECPSLGGRPQLTAKLCKKHSESHETNETFFILL
jgi:hypothetical protein